MPDNKEEMFAEAAHHWDLERLYKALEEAKRKMAPRSRKGLTGTEKLYLRGLLCGNSPAEMARLLFQSPKGVEVYMSKTLYQYFKNLVEVPNEKVGNWRNIISGLEEAGYKSQSHDESQFSNGSLEDLLVKVLNVSINKNPVTIEKNTITITINIQLSSSPSESHRTEDIEYGDRPQ